MLIFLMYKLFIFFYFSRGFVTDDGQYLVVSVSKGCDIFNLVYYFDLKSVNNKITQKLDLKPLFTKLNAKFSVKKNYLKFKI